MYTAPKLVELLVKQHKKRDQEGLFKQGSFSLSWRGKVGSSPYPDLETIVSAGEPCDFWGWNPREDFGNLNDRKPQLPLNGYIPASAIRGIVRMWAKKRPEIRERMFELLGNQTDDKITSGKIEFLDGWTKEPIRLTLDIVNPQEEFQVFHDSNNQGKPLPFYTLGNGDQPLEFTIAIRGIAGKASVEDVGEAWEWVEQALSLYGVGSRTAAGYGAMRSSEKISIKPEPEYAVKEFDFKLYSQGCYGAYPPTRDDRRGHPELRPSHWRGWLRSWVLRFLLGVMSEHDAQKTLGELLGAIELEQKPQQKQGCVRITMNKGKVWGDKSSDSPDFYTWHGNLVVTAPKDILINIILPIIRFAVMTGGVGRGWRRPLHMFEMEIPQKDRDGKKIGVKHIKASRGCHMIMMHKVKNKDSQQMESKPFGLPLTGEEWHKLYDKWLEAAKSHWGNRINENLFPINAEVFSPKTCAVYIVPSPKSEPVDRQNLNWSINKPTETRGEGMNLIYQTKYKRKSDVGGDAAGGGNAHCSWVSIKRVNIPNKELDTSCQEIVCLFLGEENNLRSQFLDDLSGINGRKHLFGVRSQR